MTHGSREEILARVRAALADVPAEEPIEPAEEPRDYRTRHAQGDVVGLLAENLADYRAIVHRVAAEELTDAAGAPPPRPRGPRAGGAPPPPAPPASGILRSKQGRIP
jgi:L-lactate dehydrogenase complex protein LldG